MLHLALALAAVPALQDGAPTELSVEWIYSDAGAEPTKLPDFAWTADGQLLFQDARAPEAERALERIDPRSGRRAPAVDAADALASLRALLGSDAPDALPWPDALDPAGRRGVLRVGADLYVLEFDGARARRVASGTKPGTERLSPDGQKLAFVRDNDLFVQHLATGDEQRLTRDGSETVLNGTLSWVYWEELFGRTDTGYWWAPDSSAIAFLRTDESPVGLMHFVHYEPELPELVRQRYPKAGTTNPIVTLGVASLKDGATVWLDASEVPYEYLARVFWLPDAQQLIVATLNRAQTRLGLYAVDRASGAAQHVKTQTDPGWVNVHDDLVFLNGGQQFLWRAEDDGFAHVLRFDRAGKLVNRVTEGDWALKSSGGLPGDRAIVAVDEALGVVYFTAQELSSIERHLYRVGLDGEGLQRISREHGTHAVTFSPDASFYVDAHSSARALPSLSLHAADGTLVAVLAAPRTELVADFDLVYPELRSIPASDGFELPAHVFRPHGFDATRRHPVVLYVYGGPSAPVVRDAWNQRTYFDNLLVQRGFVVVRVDNRSATGISKTLENSIVEQVYSDVERNDLVAATRWIKQQSWCDPERVGVWGWSGGGTFTLLLMTRSDEFKAGISVAPVTDWRYYDTIWTESFMKRPQDNPEGYAKSSLVARAKDLHGRLLLVHGTYDDNVHPQNAWAFSEGLIQAGIPFDMMIYPMRKHSIADRAARRHLFNKMLEFWDRNLGDGTHGS